MQFILRNHTVSSIYNILLSKCTQAWLKIGLKARFVLKEVGKKSNDSFSQAEHFPFLGAHSGVQYLDMRCRTTFYVALGRLLIVDLGENEEKFEQFMIPLSGLS